MLQSVQLAGGGSMATHASNFLWERSPSDALPELVEGDRDRIGQVLQNLCTNAMKWGAGRPVRVRVHLDWRSQLVITEAGMDAFISKPLRAEAIAMVRASAAEHAEMRAMEEEMALRGAPPKKPRRAEEQPAPHLAAEE